jgi:hypothetical protein
MAPLTRPTGSVDAIDCEYCGGTFALQTADAGMEKLRGDLRVWLNQVVRGAGVGASVDEAARRFIYGKELLPALQTALSRAVESFEMVRFHPFFTAPVLASLPRSEFGDAVTRVVDSSGFKDALGTTLSRVQSVEIQAFATSDLDRAQLSVLESRCLEALHLTNARHQIHAFTREGLAAASHNLQALEQQYLGTAGVLSAHDPDQARLMEAMAERSRGARIATDTVRQVVEGYGYSETTSGPEWDRAVESCEAAARRLEEIGAHSVEHIATINGARNDARGIRLLQRCLEIASDCGVSAAGELNAFFQQVSNILVQGIDANAGLDSVNAVLEQFADHVKACRGRATAWVDGMALLPDTARALAKSSLFSGKESVSIDGQMLIPFWVADLTFSQQTGMVFKKGHATDALLLVDASRHGQGSFVIAPEASWYRPVQQSMEAPTGLPGGAVVAPIVSPAQARASWRRFVQSTQGYQGGNATLRGLVYLPLVMATYTNKKGSRQAGFLFGGVGEVPIPRPHAAPLGTLQLQLL